jgi:predicted phosphoadenosine phosphosulfate sulfurtransferase
MVHRVNTNLTWLEQQQTAAENEGIFISFFGCATVNNRIFEACHRCQSMARKMRLEHPHNLPQKHHNNLPHKVTKASWSKYG